MTTLHNMTLGHCNIQGGLLSMNKSTQVIQLIRKYDLDLLCLNETNLDDTVDSSTLNIPTGYTIVRRDRRKGSRGGCAIIISKNCAFAEIDMKSKLEDIEAIWIKVKSSNIYVCCFYRSSRFCKTDKFLDYMNECMGKIPGKRVIWIGDINLDQGKINSPDYKKLDATLKSFGMVQTIREPTRIAKRVDKITKTTIDVIFTNCYSDFDSSQVLPDCLGDHQALKCVIHFQVKRAAKFEKKVIRDFSSSNMKAFRNYLKITDYSGILACNDVEAAANGLDYHLNAKFEEFFPLRTIKVHPNFIYKPSEKSLEAIKLKRKMYKKFKRKLLKVEKSGCLRCKLCQRCKICDDAWEKYKKARNHCNLTTKLNKKENFAKDIRAKSAKKDIKGVWKTIKVAANMAPKSNVQMRIDNLCPTELNDHFCSIGPKIQSDIPVSEHTVASFLNEIPRPSSSITEFMGITSEEIKAYVKSIPNEKAIADQIPIKVFKYIIGTILIPMTHIVNLSLAAGIFPSMCKYARVAAIHKGGEKDDPNNYRPISILPILGKSIEYLVHNQLSRYCEDNNILSDHQYGFRKNSSTTYLINDLMDSLYDYKDTNLTPSLLFLDIKKAFDTVDHGLLIEKLKFYGVNGTVILWIESFLSDRYQATRVGQNQSAFMRILCGVPQGSILGPLLFSIFINDITSICHLSKPCLFADDGALLFEDTCRETYLAIKLEMLTITKWLEVNKLSLNTSKTKFMVFDNKSECDSITLLDGSIIHEVKTVKYLGLMLDNKLRFGEHIDYIKKKVLKRIGAMYRASSLLPIKHRKMFANSLMLPQFDYLDTVYSRANKTKLGELDIIYKKVAKIALGVSRTESSIVVYNDMKWLPLHLRRQLHLSSYMYKIVNGNCPNEFKDKINYISGGTREGTNCNLTTPRSKSHKQFCFLGAKCWNAVPTDLRGLEDSGSFNRIFKIRLLESIKTDTNYTINNAFDLFYKAIEIPESGNVPEQIRAVLDSVTRV